MKNFKNTFNLTSEEINEASNYAQEIMCEYAEGRNILGEITVENGEVYYINSDLDPWDREELTSDLQRIFDQHFEYQENEIALRKSVK